MNADRVRAPSFVSGAAWGVAGGATGALVGHLGVMLAHRWTIGDANIWLKGQHGPPFFDLTLSNSLFYGVLGAWIYRGRARPRGAGIGFFVSFLALAVPLASATRLFSWGEGPAEPETLAWFYLVLVVNAAATLLSIAALGLCSRRPASWRRAGGAAGAGILAYLIQFAVRWAFPFWGNAVEVIGLWAPPSAVYSGMLWGGLVGAALFWNIAED